MSIIFTPLERLIHLLSNGVTNSIFIFLTYDSFRQNTSHTMIMIVTTDSETNKINQYVLNQWLKPKLFCFEWIPQRSMRRFTRASTCETRNLVSLSVRRPRGLEDLTGSSPACLPSASPSLRRSDGKQHTSVTNQSPISHQSVTNQSPISHQSVTNQSPISHQSVTNQSPISHQSVTNQSPISHQSVTNQSPISHQSVTNQSPISHQSVTNQSPISHQSVTK